MPSRSPRNIAFFGSSLVSSYWNGAATYYRGIIKALARRGHRVTFYEPDAFDRQKHRDFSATRWADVVVYEPTVQSATAALQLARNADIVIKASGVGVLDGWLEQSIVDKNVGAPGALKIFWDVDAPATLQSIHADADSPLRSLIPRYDFILSYGGGKKVVHAYEALGAQACHPIYNALDPETHHPTPADPRFRGDLSFLGNRLPDREARVEEFFLKAVDAMPQSTFVLGGSGWGDRVSGYSNLNYIGHVFTRDHNAFNCSSLAVLNINRESMAKTGYSPPTRVFEAAGAAACLITDQWEGIEEFLEPDREVLVARSGNEVIEHLRRLTERRAREIGQAARRRILSHHTYDQRALDFERVLGGRPLAQAAGWLH